MKLKNFGISFTAVSLYTWSAGDKRGDEEIFCMHLLKTDSSSLTKPDSITLCFYLIYTTCEKTQKSSKDRAETKLLIGHLSSWSQELLEK